MEQTTKRSTSAPKLVLEPVRQSTRLESRPLAVGRYLIGSAPECDISLSVGGVAPQHCLMIVGASKTVVKAISPLTWINDGPLTEAVLKHGERLILGPVELRTRMPEVSEWVSVADDEALAIPPALPTSDVVPQYEPPQIEELLDQARQHLQTAIDDSEVPTDSWSEDLPLAEAVKIHAASVINAQTSEEPAVPEIAQVDHSPPSGELVQLRDELDRRNLELTERSRAVDYLAAELSDREQQLFARERELISRESRVLSAVAEVDQREEALTAEERAVRLTALQLEERTASLDEEQSQVQQLFVKLEPQLQALERQSSELAARVQALDARDAELVVRDAELTAREAELQQQSQEIQRLADVPATDSSALELREAAISRREAVLATSLDALQASRDQITQESAQLEQRFSELVEREQAWEQRSSELRELAQRTEGDAQGLSQRITDLEQRERVVAATETEIGERESVLLRSRSEIDAREKVLITLRAELDSREEALNQQFSQLQKDRAGLRSSQLKQQMSEQAGKKRLDEIDQALQLRKAQLDASSDRLEKFESQALELVQKSQLVQEQQQQLERLQNEFQSLQQSFTEQELNLRAATEKLALSESELQESQAHFEQELLRAQQLTANSLASPVVANEVQSTAEIEQQWAELAQSQAELALDQQELVHLRAELDEKQAELELARQEVERARAESASQTEMSSPEHGSATESESVGPHLQALLDERHSLAELKANVEREYQSLRTEREEAQRARARYEQEQEQLQAIRSEASSERDVFLIERQSVIAQRQLLDERESRIQQAESAADQLRLDTEKAREELDLVQKRLDEQRLHLEEEWQGLRDEREGLRQAEAELDAQRLELTTLAQRMEQLGTGGLEVDAAVAEDDRPAEPAFDQEPLLAQLHDLDDEPDPMGEATAEPEAIDEGEAVDEVEADPLAGHASFSSIHSTDDILPPEIAEIIRRVGGHAGASAPSAAVPPAPSRKTAETPASNSRSGGATLPRDNGEEQRLKDLLGQSSESYVDAASVHVDSLQEDYALDVDEVHELPLDVIAESEGSVAAEEQDPKSVELRSRLSEMFGIDLSPARAAHPVAEHCDQNPEPVEESNWSDTANEAEAYNEEYADQGDTGTEKQPVSESDTSDVADEQRADGFSDQSDAGEIDPVAAYMEQLLARTRKSPSKATPVVPPPPIAPVSPAIESADTQLEEPEIEPKPQPATAPAPAPRSTRKHEQVNKDALRANLDSFRTIANSQARSNVARSEGNRLILMSQAKQIFLVSSFLITLVLISTELWSERRYRLEILAGFIATTFLGFDFLRTRRRLRELGLLVQNEIDDDEDVQADTEAE